MSGKDAKPAGKPRSQGPSCLTGLASLVAAVALILGIYIARPASVDVFTRIVAWQSLGKMIPVEAADGAGGLVESSVFVVDTGPGSEGTPLLLLHGFPTSSFDWKDVWPPLCQEAARRCVAFDLLGYGLSEKPAGANYTVALHA